MHCITSGEKLSSHLRHRAQQLSGIRELETASWVWTFEFSQLASSAVAAGDSYKKLCRCGHTHIHTVIYLHIFSIFYINWDVLDILFCPLVLFVLYLKRINFQQNKKGLRVDSDNVKSIYWAITKCQVLHYVLCAYELTNLYTCPAEVHRHLTE